MVLADALLRLAADALLRLAAQIGCTGGDTTIDIGTHLAPSAHIQRTISAGKHHAAAR